MMRNYFFFLLVLLFVQQEAIAQRDAYSVFLLQTAAPAPAAKADSAKKAAPADKPLTVQEQLDDLHSSVNVIRIVGVAGFLLLGFLIFQMLNSLVKRTNVALRSLDGKIDETKRDLDRYIYELEKEAIRIDNRLVQVMHEQLSIVKQNFKEGVPGIAGGEVIQVVDHRLAIKVGDEIHRMRKRIDNMDKEVKGLGALVNSINRLVEELSGGGYEMQELVGQKYVNGMKMEARFVDNPEIPPGEEIITDVLRPEIKYKGEVIQVAKVEVGKSY